MKNKWGYLLFALAILSACASPPAVPSSPATSTAAPAVLDTSTSTPTGITPISTSTREPSATTTLVPPATATFDVASIVTRIPASPEECPTMANIPVVDLSIDVNHPSFQFSPPTEKLLDYLNKGGNPSNLIAELRRTWKREEIFTNNEAIKDLTGDGVPEILVIPTELYIFGCRDNQYQLLMSQMSHSVTMNSILLQLLGIQDMNLDGTPEVVIAEFGCGGMGAGQCLDVFIYEWNGNEFVSLIPKWENYTVGVSTVGGRTSEYLPDARLQDIDHNGTLELILIGGIPNHWDSLYYSAAPWRDQSDAYTWNGEYFVLLKTEFSAPTYRYQAVQDGDRALLRHEYEKALAFYQAAIFDNSLLGWSEAHKWHSIGLRSFEWDPEYQLTPTPEVPPDDPREYPNLAAYARYRIMLLHILQEHMPEAQTVYETLRKEFPEEKDGYAFALVARAFWDEFRSSRNVESACAEAISMTNRHREVLTFLGGEFHNFIQDIEYAPEDVCPFR